MKNLKVFSTCCALLAMFLFVATSCRQEADLTPTSSSETPKMGKIHNEGLDYLLDFFVTQDLDALKSAGTTTVHPLIISQTNEFLAVEKGIEANWEAVSNLQEYILAQYVNKGANLRDNDTEFVTTVNNANISQAAKDLLLNALAVFYAPNQNYGATVQALQQISGQAATILSNPDEVQLVQGSISVGIQSTDYWANGGIHEWASSWEIENPDEVAAAIDWGDVGKEDFKGAVTGLIFGGGAGALGGAVAASAAEILYQIIFN